MALAFVPIEEVIHAFEVICTTCPEDFMPITEYFEVTYIRLKHRNRRKNPLFPIPLWNVRDALEENLPRTNNSAEGWHSALSGKNINFPITRKLKQLEPSK